MWAEKVCGFEFFYVQYGRKALASFFFRNFDSKLFHFFLKLSAIARFRISPYFNFRKNDFPIRYTVHRGMRDLLKLERVVGKREAPYHKDETAKETSSDFQRGWSKTPGRNWLSGTHWQAAIAKH